MRPVTLRARLAFWYTGALAGMLVLLCGAFYVFLGDELYADFDASLRAQTDLTVASIEERRGVPQFEGGLQRPSDASVLALYAPDGARLIQIIPDGATFPVEPAAAPPTPGQGGAGAI